MAHLPEGAPKKQRAVCGYRRRPQGPSQKDLLGGCWLSSSCGSSGWCCWCSVSRLLFFRVHGISAVLFTAHVQVVAALHDHKQRQGCKNHKTNKDLHHVQHSLNKTEIHLKKGPAMVAGPFIKCRTLVSCGDQHQSLAKMSTSLVSLMNKPPITTVAPAMMMGYHKPLYMLPVWATIANAVVGSRPPNQPLPMW